MESLQRVVVIPTYWGRAGGVRLDGDAVYDHPTPVDEEGTLKRTLESLNVIDGDFTLVLIVVPVHPDLNDDVEKQVKSIVSSVERRYRVLIFLPNVLKEMYNHLEEKIPDINQMVNLEGYSQVRNLCILIPYLLGAEKIVLLDDDEIILGSDFLDKATEFIGDTHEGRKTLAKAGYYLQPYGGHRLTGREPWWKRLFFNQKKIMNEAFAIIDAEPRIKDTPFVFGGNMTVDRDLVKVGVPFDPYITRGEDIDYLTNVKTEGYAFVLDRELSIMHKPPPSHHEEWVKLREDIVRFLYVRQKLKEQQKYGAKHPLSIEDLNPYPGYFISSTIRTKIFITCLLLALDYTAKLKLRDAGRTLQSISLILYDYRGDVKKFHRFKKRWIEILPTLASDKSLKQTLTSKIS
ncbi:MAG: hypothetical protein V3W09_04720 [Nitrososphaerales archaeon]